MDLAATANSTEIAIAIPRQNSSKSRSRSGDGENTTSTSPSTTVDECIFLNDTVLPDGCAGAGPRAVQTGRRRHQQLACRLPVRAPHRFWLPPGASFSSVGRVVGQLSMKSPWAKRPPPISDDLDHEWRPAAQHAMLYCGHAQGKRKRRITTQLVHDLSNQLELSTDCARRVSFVVRTGGSSMAPASERQRPIPLRRRRLFAQRV